jgi:hypothetical protein
MSRNPDPPTLSQEDRENLRTMRLVRSKTNGDERSRQLFTLTLLKLQKQLAALSGIAGAQ